MDQGAAILCGIQTEGAATITKRRTNTERNSISIASSILLQTHPSTASAFATQSAPAAQPDTHSPSRHFKSASTSQQRRCFSLFDCSFENIHMASCSKNCTPRLWPNFFLLSSLSFFSFFLQAIAQRAGSACGTAHRVENEIRTNCSLSIVNWLKMASYKLRGTRMPSNASCTSTVNSPARRRRCSSSLSR